MTHHAVVSLVCSFNNRGHRKTRVRLQLYVIADIHLCLEDFLEADLLCVGIIIAVCAVFSKVNGLAPHAFTTEAHVKAFFSSTDIGWWCITCSIIHYPLFSRAPYFFAHIIYFVEIYLPKHWILDAMDKCDFRVRHCHFKVHLDLLPFGLSFVQFF